MSKIVSTGKTISLDEYHQKRVRERRRKYVWWLSGFLMLVVACVFISRLEVLQISEITVEGARVITNDEVSGEVFATLADKYFWLIPKSNAVLYPREEVQTNLMKNFPRFSSVALSIEGTNTLRISVAEREPFALYCPAVEEGCSFLDKEGFVFDEAPDFSGVVYFIYETEVPMEEFRSLSDFIENLSKLGFEPVRFADYVLLMKNGSKMFLPKKGDMDKLFLNLESFLKNPEIELNKLSQIDLRVENKIFWKIFGNN